MAGLPVGYVDPENSQSRVSDGKFDPSRGGDDVVSCLECSTHKCQPKALSGSGDHPRLCSGHAPIQTQTRRCVSFYSGPVPHLRTVKKVHAAVLRLALRAGPTALTMEGGIAAEAGVGKQTLYRNWPSVTAIVFDALAHDSTPPPGETRRYVGHGCTQRGRRGDLDRTAAFSTPVAGRLDPDRRCGGARISGAAPCASACPDAGTRPWRGRARPCPGHRNASRPPDLLPLVHAAASVRRRGAFGTRPSRDGIRPAARLREVGRRPR